MGWGDQNYDAAEPKGGGDFLKLDPGQSVDLILLGGPAKFYSLFIDGKSEKSPEPFSGAKARYYGGAYDIQAGNSKVWEMSRATLGKVDLMCRELAKRGVDPYSQILVLSRKGSGLDTEYSLVPVGPASPEVLAAAQAHAAPDLHALGALYLSPADIPAHAGPAPAIAAQAPVNDAGPPF
jgi:hypothetical protein